MDMVDHVENKRPEIICIPAECWEGCEDEWCPYTHSPAWKIAGWPTYYQSDAEAIAAAECLSSVEKE